MSLTFLFSAAQNICAFPVGGTGEAFTVTPTEFDKITWHVVPILKAFTVSVTLLVNAAEVKTISLPVPNFDDPLTEVPLNN